MSVDGRVNVARRRPKGEGSYSQRSDGTWQFRINTGKGENGARIRRYVYAPTRAKLIRKVFDLKAAGGGSIKPRAAAQWASGSNGCLRTTSSRTGAETPTLSMRLCGGCT